MSRHDKPEEMVMQKSLLYYFDCLSFEFVSISEFVMVDGVKFKKLNLEL
jgi:hypothetical protein